MRGMLLKDRMLGLLLIWFIKSRLPRCKIAELALEYVSCRCVEIQVPRYLMAEKSISCFQGIGSCQMPSSRYPSTRIACRSEC